MNSKWIEISLADGRNIFIDSDAKAKCEIKDKAANKKKSRRRFKVAVSGGASMELNFGKNAG